MTINDETKISFIYERLFEFFSRHSAPGFLFGGPNVFHPTDENVRALAQQLLSDLLKKDDFFVYNCNGMIDKEAKVMKLPYEDSQDLSTILYTMKSLRSEQERMYGDYNTNLNRLIRVFESEYNKILDEEEAELERKEQEAKEKKEYSEYLRLKKKFES